MQMKSKLRQHSNNNSVNLCKPLSSADNVAGALLADIAAPNAIMNNSIDNINNHLVQQFEDKEDSSLICISHTSPVEPPNLSFSGRANQILVRLNECQSTIHMVGNHGT